MTPTLRRKLEALAERREELERLLAEPDVSPTTPVSATFRANSPNLNRLPLHWPMKPVPRPTWPPPKACAPIPICASWPTRRSPPRRRLQALEQELALLLVPRDPRDEGNLFLEVRAGTGGDEAAIFAGDLFRMYARYARAPGLEGRDRSRQPGRARRQGGGGTRGRPGAFSRLKFESGTHRVQRCRHRIAGPHPHLGGHRGNHSGGRRSR